MRGEYATDLLLWRSVFKRVVVPLVVVPREGGY
jgi:hypothetical protein